MIEQISEWWVAAWVSLAVVCCIVGTAAGFLLGWEMAVEDVKRITAMHRNNR